MAYYILMYSVLQYEIEKFTIGQAAQNWQARRKYYRIGTSFTSGIKFRDQIQFLKGIICNPTELVDSTIRERPKLLFIFGQIGAHLIERLNQAQSCAGIVD